MYMTRFVCMCLFTHHIFIGKANIIPLSLESHIHKETELYIYINYIIVLTLSAFNNNIYVFVMILIHFHVIELPVYEFQ